MQNWFGFPHGGWWWCRSERFGTNNRLGAGIDGRLCWRWLWRRDGGDNDVCPWSRPRRLCHTHAQQFYLPFKIIQPAGQPADAGNIDEQKDKRCADDDKRKERSDSKKVFHGFQVE